MGTSRFFQIETILSCLGLIEFCLEGSGAGFILISVGIYTWDLIINCEVKKIVPLNDGI
jgi:hypothetical protein